MIRFYSKIGCSESKVIFKWRKNKNSQNSHRTTQTNTVNKSSKNRKARLEPAIRDAQNVFPPWRPTLTSRSLQSIARPFQKRFCEVFGNARILICYLSKKACEEKPLPKSHLAWFFLVFDEGKVTKENISIFWFIWPLSGKQNKPSSCWILE